MTEAPKDDVEEVIARPNKAVEQLNGQIEGLNEELREMNEVLEEKGEEIDSLSLRCHDRESCLSC